AAAATEARRHRHPLVDLDPQRRPPPAALAQAGEGPGGEVLPLHPGADHLVALALTHLDQVGQGQWLEQRAELVQAVLAAWPEVEAEVELGGGVEEHRGGTCVRRRTGASRTERRTAPARAPPRAGPRPAPARPAPPAPG